MSRKRKALLSFFGAFALIGIAILAISLSADGGLPAPYWGILGGVAWTLFGVQLIYFRREHAANFNRWRRLFQARPQPEWQYLVFGVLAAIAGLITIIAGIREWVR